MTEQTHPDGRPRSSFTTTAAAVSRLGRLRDLPVILMLAWVGWLAIPWPFSGLAQARGAANQPLSADASTGRALGTETSPGASSGPSPGLIPGPAVSAGWTVTAMQAHPAHPAVLVKPAGRRTTAGAAAVPGQSTEPGAGPGLPAEPATDPGAAGKTARAQVAAQELIALERARIAGEVHDAAGHGLATIAMQAGVALLMLDERPEQVRESLEAIRSTSMQALNHLRAALDVIDPESPDPSHSGAPDLIGLKSSGILNARAPDLGHSQTPEHDLSGLIDGVRAAGLPVVVEPAEPDVPAHLVGTVYRVVRESLTNVLRHAGPTEATVRLAADPHEFVLEVGDRGSGLSEASEGRASEGRAFEGRAFEGRASTGTIEGHGQPGRKAPVEGRGLAGMRARVLKAGGEFSAGPREAGGFRVVARFPIDREMP